MSTFTADPIYELDLKDGLCHFDRILLIEYNNIVNDTGYTYSGLTLFLDYTGFTSHFDTAEHTYSNIILNNDVYSYTGFTDEIHYFQIFSFYSGGTPSVGPEFGGLTPEQVITGFTTDIISCVEKLDMLTGTCCPTQQVLSNIPWVAITNEGGGVDNCDDYIARRTPEGWTLDFVFNKNGETGWTESVFWFTGVRDEYDRENYADNGLSFRFTDEGKIIWTAYRYSGYCATNSGYTEMFYIDTGGTSNALCSGGTANDFNITITFERNNVYDEECDLANEGGWNDLVLSTGTTEELNTKWNNSRDLRLGTLKIYHNGRPVYKLKGFEEVILSDRGYQPFTHVVGGGVTGSGGVHEGVCCYDIKYAAYFEDVMDFVYLQNRYLTITSVTYNISECEPVCVPGVVMVTPTRTPSITPTVSRTPTLTRTPTITPTITRTPTVTPSPAGINSVSGLLYNAHVIDDPRGLAAPGWNVPSQYQLAVLKANVGTDGGQLKEVGTYPPYGWLSPNIGATNITGFSARGAGGRTELGIFENIYEYGWFWTSTEDFGLNYRGQLRNNSTQFPIGLASKNRGNSIRLIKDSTTLTHGQLGTYTGNNGRVYRTVCIYGQEWMCGNLAETRYQNGDFIPEVRDNATWSGLTSGAYCAYDNTWSYVYGIAPSPSLSSTITPTPSG